MRLVRLRCECNAVPKGAAINSPLKGMMLNQRNAAPKGAAINSPLKGMINIMPFKGISRSSGGREWRDGLERLFRQDVRRVSETGGAFLFAS